MTRIIRLACGVLLLAMACRPIQEEPSTFATLLLDVPRLEGRAEYLASPYVTAGDRLYMVGFQDGSFPDLGWHVPGEMGGIWDHPIKLMDGFTVRLREEATGLDRCLEQADQFVNFPFANMHRYDWPAEQLLVERWQFVPDGLEAIAVQFSIENRSAEARTLQLEFNGMVDLRPVWLGERTGMVDGPDRLTWDAGRQVFEGKDSLQDWYVVFGADHHTSGGKAEPASCLFERRGNGATGALHYLLPIEPGASSHITFVVAGSYRSLDEAGQTFQQVMERGPELLLEKRERYATLAGTARLSIPDSAIQTAYQWVKYNTDWLVRDVPELGRGLSAGIPDYPWWFGCDNAYALQGVLATGRPELARRTLELLKRLSEATNGESGRIIHEASTNGAVYNPGNVNETPQFCSLVWTYFQWTGDRDLLEEFYPFCKNGLAWLLDKADVDGNLLPDGAGMMEIHGLESEMIDVAVYTQQAFADMAEMAGYMGEAEYSRRCMDIAEQLKEDINTRFWAPAFRSYADFIGTTAQTLTLIDDAIVRADTLGKPWAVAELEQTRKQIAKLPADQKQGQVVHHNWVVNTPMETGVADTAKALAALATGSRFVNPFGMFVTGIDRDDSAGSDEGSFAARKKTFTYVGAVMTLPTGVQAIAEANYGRPEESLDYLRRMTRSFGYALPGSMYEVSPDFGMIVQAWNVYALATPIVEHYFGIRPRAFDRAVELHPLMPAHWTDVSLERVIVGDNELSVYKTTEAANGQVFRVLQKDPEWKIAFFWPDSSDLVLLNGQPARIVPQEHGWRLDLTGAENRLEIR